MSVTDLTLNDLDPWARSLGEQLVQTIFGKPATGEEPVGGLFEVAADVIGRLADGQPRPLWNG